MIDVRPLLRVTGDLPEPRSTPGTDLDKAGARDEIADVGSELADLQERLFANGKHGDERRVLLLLQGRDASGKDGGVRRLVQSVDPAGVRITSFGPPTEEERAHEFLWRVERALPPAGHIGVWNRSHYEDVLIARVDELVPREVWEGRYDAINRWEAELAASGVVLLKVFLHISHDEQRERLLSRLDDPTKHWKFDPADLGARASWDDYAAAYDDVFARCGPDTAPWYAVPADRKWYRDWALTSLLLHTLRDLGQDWPVPAGLDIPALRARLAAG